jgi:hypothetical protein
MEISPSFLMNLFDRSWNMKTSSSTGRSLGYQRKLSSWISGRNLVSRESESDDLSCIQEADEVVSESELHLNHRNLLLSLNQLVIPLRDRLIERYVPLSCHVLMNQANREDLEAANLVLSWWNTDNTPTVTREPPPLHTDPVLPNQTTSMTDPSPNQPGPSHVPVPMTLASVDEWEVTTPLEAGTSGAASVAGSSGSGEARRITLKVNRSG